MTIKTERALRHQLSRGGYALRKMPGHSRQREVHPVGFMVVDIETNSAMIGSDPYPFSADLLEVERFTAEFC